MAVLDPRLKPIARIIEDCPTYDLHRLRSRLKAADALLREGKDAEAMCRALFDSAVKAQGAVELRRKTMAGKIEYDESLPVVQRKKEIQEAILKNQVVVVCGETGSGKTTQIPKFCLELGGGIFGQIGHTQPRRIAARTVAARIAEELHAELGQGVGYKVRFGDKVTHKTRIKLMTDGILLAETQSDPLLKHYDTIIIDEAHERSLNIDFLLGYLKEILPRRKDLKVIITSATIDPKRFSDHFSNAPIVEVSGRTYPVEVLYRPRLGEIQEHNDRSQKQAIVDALDELWRMKGKGDTLVFLSGEREIRETAEAVNKHYAGGWMGDVEVLPLFSRLSNEEQNRVFASHRNTRVVLATNVAETSLTVPGIKYVIDPGTARLSRYSSRTKVQRLMVEPVSQASADQRKGRCGRVAPGTCIRLYSEEDFAQRERFTPPEIVRSNLAAVVLQMKALKLGEIADFPFIEPPTPRMIRDGYQTLHELGAVDEKDALTTMGWELAKMPVDPRLGRMILEGQKEDALREVLVIASALSVQDPRERPLEAQDKADYAHRVFKNEGSDFIALLNIWEAFHKNAKELSNSKLRKWCSANFLSFIRLREWHDVHRQIEKLVLEAGLKLASKPATPDQVHRALLSGLLSNIGMKGDEAEYQGARGSKFFVFPGSGITKKLPKWVMAAEIVETSRMFARTAAAIKPEWLESLGKHVVTYSYSEPHYDQETGYVMAYERVQLFGLTIVPKRRMHFGRVDPKAARELFIMHAMAEGMYQSESLYYAHNRSLTEEVKLLQAKLRRQDLLADVQSRFEFFDKRVPADVCNGPGLEKWLENCEKENPRALHMTRDDLLSADASGLTPEDFPDHLPVNGLHLRLDYKVDLTHPLDGITLTIPLELIDRVEPERLEWLVPGLCREKIVELIRTLPPEWRRRLVPAPQYAKEVGAAVEFGKGAFLQAISSKLGSMIGEVIPLDVWRPEALPGYLRMNVRVVDNRKNQVAIGKDLREIKLRLRDKTQANLALLPKDHFDRDGLKTWEFGDLPERVEVSRNALTVWTYPALVEQPVGGGVGLRLMENKALAEQSTRKGLARLVLLNVEREAKAAASRLPGFDAMAIIYSSVGDKGQLKDDVLMAAVDLCFLEGQPGIRTKGEFEARIKAEKSRLDYVAREVAAQSHAALKEFQHVAIQLGQAMPANWEPALKDIKIQLGGLLAKGFVRSTPHFARGHLARYVAGAGVRIRRLANGGITRDQRAQAELSVFLGKYAQVAKDHMARGIVDGELVKLRWMIEEYRVSVFAQDLGTSVPVSMNRLEEQLGKTVK
jgi:ATP-dependent helicase HrpA